MSETREEPGATEHGRDAGWVLGLELRRRRESAGLTQHEMAKRLGLSARSAVADYESGRRKPPADILDAYERALGLEPGSLRDLRDHGLAAQAQRRYASALAARALAANVPGLPPEAKPAAPAAPSHSRPRRTPATLAALIIVCGTLTGSAAASGNPGSRIDATWSQRTQNVTDKAEPAPSPEPMDGDDPRARDCYADAATELTAPMHLPGGAAFGTLRLRHSARCGASWGSAYYVNPKLFTIRITVHRPADGAEIRFDWSNNTPPGSYSDMLSTGSGCVWVEAVVITPAGTSEPARTGCSK